MNTDLARRADTLADMLASADGKGLPGIVYHGLAYKVLQDNGGEIPDKYHDPQWLALWCKVQRGEVKSIEVKDGQLSKVVYETEKRQRRK